MKNVMKDVTKNETENQKEAAEIVIETEIETVTEIETEDTSEAQVLIDQEVVRRHRAQRSEGSLLPMMMHMVAVRKLKTGE